MAPRVPLFWILFPFALGIALSTHLTALGSWGVAAAALISIAATAKYAARSPVLLHAGIALAICFAGALRYLPAQQAFFDAADRPAREAAVTLRIEKTYNSRYAGSSIGLATIVSAPPLQSDILDARIYYSLNTAAALDPPEIGDTFAASGVLRALAHRDPEESFNQYLRHQGVAFTFVQGALETRLAAPSGLAALANRARDRSARVLQSNAAPASPFTGAYKGLMLGQKSELSKEQRDLFLANGTMHLFAISGLHIGVIALCFHQLFVLVRLPEKLRPVFSLLAVAGFVIMTGSSASAWRALLMVACFYLTKSTHRQRSPLSALALSAIIYLALFPNQLFQAGFQMSYLTVGSILIFGLPLAKTLNALLPCDGNIPNAQQSWIRKTIITSKKWILDALGVSIAAYLTSAMLGMYYFQILPTYGVLLNLIALPAASLAIVSGFLSLLLSLIDPSLHLSYLFNNAALVSIASIHALLGFTTQLPFASFATARPSLLALNLSLGATLSLQLCTYAQCGKKSEPYLQIATLLATGTAIALLVNL